jgi:ParB/RepB/Spo0J family partition protein
MVAEETPKLVWLKIEDVKVPELRLSSQFTDEEGEEFYASIGLDGVLNPIIVVDDPNGNRWLVDGANRLEAAKKLGHKVIPAIIKCGTIDDAILGSALLNLKRGRVNLGYLAEYLKSLVEKYNYTQQAIADKLRLSKSYVSRLLKIAQNREILEELKSGKLTFDQAYAKAQSFVTKPQEGSESSSKSSETPKVEKPATESKQSLTDEDLGVAEMGKRLPISDKDIKANIEEDRSPRRCDFCGQWMSRDEFSYIIVHKGLCKQMAMEAIQKATMNPQPQPGGECESAGGLRKGGGESG